MTEHDLLTRELVATWDAGAATYDGLPRHGIRHDDERRAWRRLVAAILGDAAHASVPKLRVLDVGTGTGVLAFLAAELGHDVTAIDLSPGMLAQARRYALDAGLAVTWLEGDAEDLIGDGLETVGTLADVIRRRSPSLSRVTSAPEGSS